MTKYEEFKAKQLSNPVIKAEYDALEPEYDIIRALIEARNSQNLTQVELSKRTGIAQSDISKLEKGVRNPSLETLKRLANGLGMQLRIEFVPKI